MCVRWHVNGSVTIARARCKYSTREISIEQYLVIASYDYKKIDSGYEKTSLSTFVQSW